MQNQNYNSLGLSDAEVIASRTRLGANILEFKKKNVFIDSVISIEKEPMVTILPAARVKWRARL